MTKVDDVSLPMMILSVRWSANFDDHDASGVADAFANLSVVDVCLPCTKRLNGING